VSSYYIYKPAADISTTIVGPFPLDEKTARVCVEICTAYFQVGQVLFENKQYVLLRTFTV
jgi:hypothetical protein